MAGNLDQGYDSPSEQTAITNRTPQNGERRDSRHPCSPWNWAGYFRWCSPRRYFVVIMSFFGFYNVYALQVNFPVAIADMTSTKIELSSDGNYTLKDPEFDWSPKTQENILDSFYYGYILTQIPGAYLASTFGPKKVLGICISLENFLMSLFLFTNSLYALIVVRIGEGLLLGVTFPSMYLMLSKWIQTSEKSKLTTAAISGSYFGVFVTLPLAKILIDTFKWYIAIDFFAFSGFVWAILWLFIIAESPKADPYISDDELQFIESSIENAFSRDKMPLSVPWRNILLSFPVWAIIIAHICENWGFYTLLRVLPRFMNDMFNYSVYSDVLSSLPYLLMGITVLLGGFIASWLQDHEYLTTIQIRKIFNCGGFLGRAIFLLIAAHSQSQTTSIIFFTLSLGFGGFAWSGFGINHFDISPPYSCFLIGLSNTFATLPGIISPVITDLLVEKGNRVEWVHVFYVSSGIYIFGAIFYGIYASSEVQSLSRIEENSHQEDNISLNLEGLHPEEPNYE